MSVLDFSRTRTTTVFASPAAAAETTIAQLPALTIRQTSPIDFEATCDVTIGTTGNAVTFRVRRGLGAGGLLVATFGPFTAVAASRALYTIGATDSWVTERYGQLYALTMQVTAATAVSTVNAVYFGAMY